jgi:hypothetical protein
VETLFGVPADLYKAVRFPWTFLLVFLLLSYPKSLIHLALFTSPYVPYIPKLQSILLIVNMSETKAPEATVVSQQPGTQAQPTLSKLQQVTGTEEWHDDIFNCFEGPNNLCGYSR